MTVPSVFFLWSVLFGQYLSESVWPCKRGGMCWCGQAAIIMYLLSQTLNDSQLQNNRQRFNGLMWVRLRERFKERQRESVYIRARVCVDEVAYKDTESIYTTDVCSRERESMNRMYQWVNREKDIGNVCARWGGGTKRHRVWVDLDQGRKEIVNRMHSELIQRIIKVTYVQKVGWG